MPNRSYLAAPTRLHGRRAAAVWARPVLAMTSPRGDGFRLVRFLRTHPGLRGVRLRAFQRAAAWQVAKRRGALRARVRVGPAQIYCYPGSTGASGMLYAGLPEWDDMLFAIRCLRPGERFVDVGANVGAYSVLVSCYRPGTQITAVEPDEEARHRLTENLELNGINAEVVPAALASASGRRAFTRGRDTVNRLALDSAEAAVDVDALTLDDVVGDRPVSLVKVDVEGAELEVFSGGQRLLGGPEAPQLLFELNGECANYGATVQAVRAHLVSIGYQLFVYQAAGDALVPFTGDELPPSGNVVATKDPDTLARRLADGGAGGTVAVPLNVSMQIEHA